MQMTFELMYTVDMCLDFVTEVHRSDFKIAAGRIIT